MLSYARVTPLTKDIAMRYILLNFEQLQILQKASTLAHLTISEHVRNRSSQIIKSLKLLIEKAHSFAVMHGHILAFPEKN